MIKVGDKVVSLGYGEGIYVDPSIVFEVVEVEFGYLRFKDCTMELPEYLFTLTEFNSTEELEAFKKSEVEKEELKELERLKRKYENTNH